jgi:FkbM family methyltransferase
MKQIVKSMLGSYYTPKMRHLKRRMEVRYLGKGEPELALLPHLVDPGKVAIDVGANIGDFLDVLARHASRAIAFEPNPVCLAHLRAIELKHCTIVDVALSDRSGTATLKVPVEEAEVTGLGTIEAANRSFAATASGLRSYEVRTARLDEVIGEQLRSGETIGFVKIDVEGHEHAVLEGARATIERHRPIVMVETEYRHGAPVPAIFELFAGLGYDARVLLRGRLEEVDAERLALLQGGIATDEIVKDARGSIYVNNVWFVPRERQDLLAALH